MGGWVCDVWVGHGCVVVMLDTISFYLLTHTKPTLCSTCMHAQGFLLMDQPCHLPNLKEKLYRNTLLPSESSTHSTLSINRIPYQAFS